MLFRSTLRGTEVGLRARGNLRATQLEAETDTTRDRGHLTLEAGGSGGTSPALQLEATQLSGHTIRIMANGAVALERVHAQAGTDGAPGEIGIVARSPANAAAATLNLRDVTLKGGGVTLSATGDLQADALLSQAQRHWLRAGSGTLHGEGDLLLNNTALRGPSSGGTAAAAQMI